MILIFLWSLFFVLVWGRGGGAATLLNIWDVLWDCSFRLTYFCYIYHHWLRLMIKGIPDYMIVLRLKFVLHCLVSIKRPELKSNMLFRFNFLKVTDSVYRHIKDCSCSSILDALFFSGIKIFTLEKWTE